MSSSVIQSLAVKIAIIRGERVILDSDLAAVYGVPTKRFNEQVRRNIKRFPSDFMFRLSRQETEELLCSRSQNATLKRGQNVKYLPLAFTEHGALMAANVLRTDRAIRMSVFVVRAFIKMRQLLGQNQELAEKLHSLEKELKGRLDSHEAAIVSVLQKIMLVLNPPLAPSISEVKPKRKMGFHSD